MKISELVNLVGIYERVRVISADLDEITTCMAKDLSPEMLNKNIKNLYADRSTISIIIKRP